MQHILGSIKSHLATGSNLKKPLNVYNELTTKSIQVRALNQQIWIQCLGLSWDEAQKFKTNDFHKTGNLFCTFFLIISPLRFSHWWIHGAFQKITTKAAAFTRSVQTRSSIKNDKNTNILQTKIEWKGSNWKLDLTWIDMKKLEKVISGIKCSWLLHHQLLNPSIKPE